MMELITSLALLLSPVDEISNQEKILQEAFQPLIIGICVEMHVIDHRESHQNTFFEEYEEQENYLDLLSLRQKFRNYLKYPILEELNRFPSKTTCEEYINFNFKFKESFQKRAIIDPFHKEQLLYAITEMDQLRNIWELLLTANREYYYVWVRRQALQDLKEIIGDEAFYSGRMPPHIPHWYIPSK